MPYRVLFHLNESSACKVEGVLGNVEHLLDELGQEGLAVEVVAHGDGIAALRQAANPHADAIARLAGRGVRFAACQNTMKRQGLEASDLLRVAEMVPSGVAELVRRQAEGWAYVRP
jgi:intracellular sulfur oxidation DsrE/DsrF family protein